MCLDFQAINIEAMYRALNPSKVDRYHHRLLKKLRQQPYISAIFFGKETSFDFYQMALQPNQVKRETVNFGDDDSVSSRASFRHIQQLYSVVQWIMQFSEKEFYVGPNPTRTKCVELFRAMLVSD